MRICTMAQYTAYEAMELITGDNDAMSDDESEIDEDPAFLLPHSDDELETELEPALTETLSPAPTLTSNVPAASTTATAVHSNGK